MDAAARAELDVLRRRAYGPSPDIADDGPALERLVALEELARPAALADPDPAPEAPARSAGTGGPTDAKPIDARVVAVRSAAPRRRRPRWHSALVAAVAAVTLTFAITAVQRALQENAAPMVAREQRMSEVRAFTTDPASEVLMSVRTDGYFGDYVDIASPSDVPVFPVEGLMTWVEPLGEYYGWNLWIGGARGAIDDESCLLLDGVSGPMFSDCVADDLRAEGALLVSVPFDAVHPDERPAGMTPGQNLGFWWDEGGNVQILLSPTPAG